MVGGSTIIVIRCGGLGTVTAINRGRGGSRIYCLGVGGGKRRVKCQSDALGLTLVTLDPGICVCCFDKYYIPKHYGPWVAVIE